MMNTLVFIEFKNFNVGRNGGGSKLRPKSEIYREHRGNFGQNGPKITIFGLYFLYFHL